MFLPKSYKEIKLVHGGRIDQIKNFDQQKWMNICERLELFVVPAKGKGSHCAVYKSKDCPSENSECCVLTIVRNIYPNIQRDLAKKLVFYGIQSGKYTEDDFWIAAGFK